MPEGLSPIEAGKKLHEHTTEPHQPATSAWQPAFADGAGR